MSLSARFLAAVRFLGPGPVIVASRNGADTLRVMRLKSLVMGPPAEASISAGRV